MTERTWTTIPMTKEVMKKIHEYKPEGQAYWRYINNLIEEVEE